MTFFIILLIVVLFIIFNLIYFLSSRLSPIPFFPTNKKDLPKIAATILSSKSVVVDLGAGTGTVIFAAAKTALDRQPNPKQPRGLSGLSEQFIAVEIHPLLIFIMHVRRLFHPNRKNIKILRADIFKMDYKQFLTFKNKLLTVYIYVGPFVMDRLIPQLQTLPKKTRIISYMYELPGWKKKLKKTVKGVNKIYEYSL